MAQYIHNKITFKTLEKLTKYNKHIESINHWNNKGTSEEYHFAVHLQISKRQPKIAVLVADLNLNSLDWATNNHVQNFFSLASENIVFPVINRSKKIMKANATATDHILTNIY